MNYNHKKRVLITTREETQLLKDAKKLLYEMFKKTGCRNKYISTAYQHLSILLEQYRYHRRKNKLSENL